MLSVNSFMKSSITVILALFFAMVVSAIAFAQTVPPETIEGATGMMPALIHALVEGNYLVAAGFGLMIVVAVVRVYLLPKISVTKELLPIISAIIGVIAFGGLALSAGQDFMEALKNGLVTSLLAGGTWSLVGKWLAKLVLGDKYLES